MHFKEARPDIQPLQEPHLNVLGIFIFIRRVVLQIQSDF